MGVIEPGTGTGLETKTLHLDLARPVADENHLERHFAIQAGLAGAVDDAHAAPGNLGGEFIVADGPPAVAAGKTGGRFIVSVAAQAGLQQA